jgi:hypothetical protein
VSPDDVRARVQAIARVAERSPELAHGRQDDLWLSVLQAIADGAENPRELAAEAIKADDVNFPRWYA